MNVFFNKNTKSELCYSQFISNLGVRFFVEFVLIVFCIRSLILGAIFKIDLIMCLVSALSCLLILVSFRLFDVHFKKIIYLIYFYYFYSTFWAGCICEFLFLNINNNTVDVSLFYYILRIDNSFFFMYCLIFGLGVLLSSIGMIFGTNFKFDKIVFRVLLGILFAAFIYLLILATFSTKVNTPGKSLYFFFYKFIISAIVLVCLQAKFFYEKNEKIKVNNYVQKDIIEFGYYPQSQVTDRKVTDSLKGVLYRTDSKWITMEYGMFTSKMRVEYIDITYLGDKYRGIKVINKADDKKIHINGYIYDVIYWFKFKPIEWIVIADGGGYKKLLSKLILDCRYFNSVTYAEKLKENEKKLNEFKYSQLREWLNNTFLNDSLKIKEINELAYVNFYDKITLLSINDFLKYVKFENVVNKYSDYSLFLWTIISDNTRGHWWIKSDQAFSETTVEICNSEDTSKRLYDDLSGVRPVIYIENDARIV